VHGGAGIVCSCEDGGSGVGRGTTRASVWSTHFVQGEGIINAGGRDKTGKKTINKIF